MFECKDLLLLPVKDPDQKKCLSALPDRGADFRWVNAVLHKKKVMLGVCGVLA